MSNAVKIDSKELTTLAKRLNEGSLSEEYIRREHGESAFKRVTTIAQTMRLKDLGYLKPNVNKKPLSKIVREVIYKVKTFLGFKRSFVVNSDIREQVLRLKDLEVREVKSAIESAATNHELNA